MRSTIICFDSNRSPRSLANDALIFHDIESLKEVCDAYLIFAKDGIIEIDEEIDRERVNAMIGDSYD